MSFGTKSGNSMKWQNHRPMYRALRVKSKFLFFPKTISGQTRWLEFAGWIEQYQSLMLSDKFGFIRWRDKWTEIKWL